MAIDKNKIIETLKTVYDPEIPVNVYDLGLIYEINVNENDEVKIVMTLTAPGCPLAEQLPEQVKQAVAAVQGVKSVWVELTFDPVWTPERLSEEARILLNYNP